MINKYLKNKIARNAGWIIAEKIIQMVISLIISLITARYLGPANYGIINYAGAYTGIFFSLSTLGINSIIVKEILDNPSEEGKVMGTTLVLQLIASIFSYISIIGIVFIVDVGEPTTILVVGLNCISILFNILGTMRFWFQSKLKSKITASCTLIAYIITSLYKLFLVISGKGVVYFALSISIDYLILGILLYISYKKNNGQKLKFSWEYGKVILSKSHHFILSGIMISIYAQTDKFMLKQMVNATEIGYYSTACAICNMWCFVLSAIIDSMQPSIIDAYKTNKETFDKRNKLLYAIIFYVSVCVSIIFSVFAELIIYILYGNEYIAAAMPLRIVTWYTSFSYLGVARNTWMVCNNKQKYLKYIYLISAVLNVLLNLLFVPVLGASGAAIASVITQVGTIIFPLFIRDFRENTLLMIDAILLRGLRKK